MANFNLSSSFSHILFLFFSIFILQEMQAAHTGGMEMFYRHKSTSNSDSTYEFTLVYYSNCQGVTAGSPYSVNLSAVASSINKSGSIACSKLRTTGKGVPSLKPANMFNCTKSINVLCYKEYVYRGDWTSPKRAKDWKFYFQICCGPTVNAPTNVQNNTRYIECGLNNLDFPDFKSKNWSPLWHNRRPNHPGYTSDTVINYLFKTLCSYKYYSLDLGVKEYQGDSVTYNLYWPQTNGGNKSVYINGWSFISPLPTLNGTLNINKHTGIIPIIPGAPTGTGIYILGIEAKEWRYDTIVSGGSTVIVAKQIGYVRRDMTIRIEDSSSCRRDSAHPKDIYLDTINVNKKLRVHFQNVGQNTLIRCNTISPDGSEFRIVDSSHYVYPFDTTLRFIGVYKAEWICLGGMTEEIELSLANPITCGEYYLILRKGTDLDVLQSECGYWEPEYSSARIHTGSLIPVDIGPDTTVCKWSAFSIQLKTDSLYASYYWNTRDTTQDINISYPGKYWLKVKNNFECISSDTMYVLEKLCDSTTNTGISEISIQEVEVFPNPSSGRVNIFLDTPEAIGEVRLFNNSGTRMIDQSFKKSTNGYLLNLEGLAQGVYYLHIIGKNGDSIVKKLIYTKKS